MKIIPAVDIFEGKCVRLNQGNFDKATVYSDDPVEAVLKFQDAGLQYLHLVDLDGARKGCVVNWSIVQRIIKSTNLTIDFGGGVKTEEDIKRLFDLGVAQINIGSIAINDPQKFIQWIERYGADKFILSADVKNECVVTNGWSKNTEVNVFDLVDALAREGLKNLTCTDVEMDGMMMGPNLNLYKRLKNTFPFLNLTASGGIATKEDLKKLESLSVDGAIVGKALYEKKLILEDIKP